MSEKICVECKEPITGESVFYDDNFIVCKPCHDTTERNWKEDKKMLRDQGIDPDACTYIEDHLNDRPEVGIEARTTLHPKHSAIVLGLGKPDPSPLAPFADEQNQVAQEALKEGK